MLVLVFFSFSVFAQVPWVEDFEDLSDGVIVDNGATQWLRDVSGGTLGRFEVQDDPGNNYFLSLDTDGPFIWESESINISSVANVKIQLDVWSENNGQMEDADYVRGTYEVDNSGIEIEFFNLINDIGLNNVSTVTSGTSVIVRIYTNSTATNEWHYFDNIQVSEFIPVKLYSRRSSNWDNSNPGIGTWSLTSGGPASGLVPDAETQVFIQNGDQVTIGTPADVMSLNIENGDISFTASTNLTINNGGTVTINSGTTIDGSGFVSNLIFDNGNNFQLIVNDNSPGINVEEIHVRNISSLTISGTGSIQTSDDVEFQNNNAVITNFVDTLYVGDGFDMDANIHFSASDCQLINNGTIVNNNSSWGIIYNGSNNTLTNNGVIEFYNLDFFSNSIGVFNNYGTVNQHGIIENVSSVGDAGIYNYAGAIWNYEGSTYDSDIELYCNYEGNTFNYNRNGNQDIITPQDTYWHLETSGGAGNKNLTGDITILGDLNIGTGTRFHVTLFNYNIAIHGNWYHYGTGAFDEREGTVSFIGSGDQNILGTPDEMFYNLIIDKTNSLTTTSPGNIIVTGTLDMTSGIINIPNDTLRLTSSNAASLVYSSGYVIGKFQRAVNSNSSYFFPVGIVETNGTIITPNDSPNGLITVGFFDTPPGGAANFVDGAVTVVNVFDDGYWNISADGTFSSSDFNISLDATGFINNGISTATRVLKRPAGIGGVWDNPITGIHGNASPPIIYRNAINSGIATSQSYDFGCGNTDCAPILTHPVSLSSCSGQNATFTVVGNSAISYQWKKNGVDISGASTDSYTINGITQDDIGSYSCVVTAACGTETSNSASLIVADPLASFGYAYEKDIIVNSNQVSGTEALSNFPILISHTDPELMTVANGGYVENTNGYDIAFADVNGYKLDHELEYYNGASGEIVAWVRIPVLSATANTTIKILYGNPAVSSSTANADGVWISNNEGVWHFQSDFTDASPKNNHGTNNNVAIGSGFIGNASVFDNTLDHVEIGMTGMSLAEGSISLWANTNNSSGNTYLFGHSSSQLSSFEDRIQLYTGSNDNLNLGLKGNHTLATDISYLNPGSWNMINLNWNIGNYEIYINGVQVDNGSYSDLTAKHTTADIGNDGRSDLRDEGWDGYIDEFRIFSGAKSADWIATEYRNQNSPTSFYSMGTQSVHSNYSLDVCEDEHYIYTVPFEFDTYSWAINGGTQINSADNDTAIVAWQTAGAHDIRLDITDNGCTSTSEVISLSTYSAKPTPNITGVDTVCPNSTGVAYSTPVEGSNSYFWEFEGGLLQSGQSTNSITMDWTSGADTFLIVYDTIVSSGCGWSDTMHVVIGDFEKPTFIVNDSTIYLNGAGSFTIDSSYVSSGFANNCLSDITSTLSRSVFGCADLALSPIAITVTVSDEYGNDSVNTAYVTVLDTISPTLTAITDTSVHLDADCNFSIPDYRYRTSVSDNCPSDLVISQRPLLGTILSTHSNDTTIWIIADDGHGNLDSTSFVLTVLDTISPTLTAIADTSVHLDAGCNFSIPDYRYRTTVSDNCPSDLVISQRPLLGTILSTHSNDTTIWIIADDGHGNLDSTSFVLTVLDTISPTLTAIADTSVHLDAGCNFSIPDYRYRTTVSDNCPSDLVISQRPLLGTILSTHSNDTSIWIIADDGHGNLDSTSFVLTVLDTISPTLTAIADTSVHLDAGCNFSIPDYRYRTTVSDNCPSDLVISQRPLLGTILSTHSNDTTIWIIADDGHGNLDSTSFVLTVLDTISPTLTAIADTSVHLDAGCNFSIPDYRYRTTVSDNCPADLVISQRPLLGTILSTHSNDTTIWIIADDGHGNLDSTSFVLTVLDTISPTLTAVADTSVHLDAGCNFSIPDYRYRTTVSDNCPSDLVISQRPLSGTILSTHSNDTTIWIIADDGHGNLDSTSFVLTVLDTISPTLTAIADTSVHLDAGCNFSIPDYRYRTTVSDNCPSDLVISQRPLSGTILSTHNNDTTIWIIADDGHGNLDSTSFVLTVLDTISPTLTAIADTSVHLDAGCNFSIPDYRYRTTVSDNCPSDLVISQRPLLGTILSTHSNDTTIWIIADDGHGNLDSTSFVLTVLDTISPTLTAIADTSVHLDAGCNFSIPDYRYRTTVSDNCPSDLVISQRPLLGTILSTHSNDTTIWIIADDGHGNLDSTSFVLTVLDTISPTLTAIADTSVHLDAGCNFSIPDYRYRTTVSDNCPSDLVISQRPLSGTILSTHNNDTTIWIIADDGHGNLDSTSFVLTVLDTISPTLTAIADTSVHLDAGCNFSIPDYRYRTTVSDNCPSDLVISQRPLLGTILSTHSNDTTIWIIADDGHGNLDSTSFVLTVLDTISPTLTAIADTSVHLDAGCNFSIPDYRYRTTVSDNCPSDLVISQRPLLGTILSTHSNDTTIWIIADDGHGNLDSTSFVLTVLDTISPTLTAIADTSVHLDAGCNFSIPDYRYRTTVSDNCPSDLVISQRPLLGTILSTHSNDTTIWIIADDGHGNLDSTSFVLTVLDTISPTLTAIADTSVHLDAGCNFSIPDYRYRTTVSDNCPSDLVISQRPLLGTILSTHSNDTTIWIIADDGHGNLDSTSFVLTVLDTISPTLTAIADTSVHLDAGCNFSIPDYRYRTTVSDNCPSDLVISQRPLSGTILSTHNNDTTIWIIADDGHGNLDSVSFVLTVLDTVPPIAVARPTLDVNISLATGLALIYAADIENGSYDNCSAIARDSINIDTFRCDDIGNTIPVVLWVWDAVGNNNTDTTLVKILGYNTEPAITFNMETDSMLCSGEYDTIRFISNADSTSYSWVINAPSSITGWSDGLVNYPPGGDYLFYQQFSNSSDTAQRVGVTLSASLFNRCPQTQFDTTIYFWVIPGLSTDLIPNYDTICNHDTLGIEISSANVFDNLRFKYNIIADNPGLVDIGWLGDTTDLLKGHRIQDTIHNRSTIAQRLEVTATPYISEAVATAGSCTGTPETIEVWVEPTPLLNVSIADTIVCDSVETTIVVNDLLGLTKGNKVYELITTDATGFVTGVQTSGTYATGLDVIDTLKNSTTQVQMISYQFIARIVNNGGYCDNGTDTTIYVYVNPTPELDISLVDTIICNDDRINLTIDSAMSSLGEVRYHLLVDYGISGLSGELSNAEYDIVSLQDSLHNATDTVREAKYTFTAYIEGATNIGDCENGWDTTIIVYVNPTPELEISVLDTIVCNDELFDISIDSSVASLGKVRYHLNVDYASGTVTGRHSNIDYDIATLQDSIHNPTDIAKEVIYTFTAFIEGATNLGDCENGLDTTIHIWVEPTPLVVAAAVEDTICNLDNAIITLASPTIPSVREVKFRWRAWSELPTTVTGFPADSANWQYGGGINEDSTIVNQLVNNTNSNQKIYFEIEAITLDADSIMRCSSGISDTVIVIVQPGLLVELVPQGDTICDASAVSINITSISNPSGTFLFSYQVRPENSSSVSITYTNALDTLGVPKGHTIIDKLDNLSDTAQLVRFIVTPFVSGGGGCPGTPDTSYIWVEPTPKVLLTPQADTICDGESSNFTITSPTDPTIPVLFSFMRDYNTDSLSVVASADTDLVKNTVVNEQITNHTHSVQAIKYIVTPYTLDGNNNPRCINGDKDTIYILVNPTPDISVVASLDSILCDSATVSFSIDSLSDGLIGDWVYDVDTVPSNYGLIKGYSGGNNLTADFADQLINLSKSVQWVDYIFHPQILHTSTGVPYCGNNAVNDTTIRIYVNPTPELEIPILDTLVCNDEVFDISIDSSVASLGKVRYHLVVDYAGGAVTGRHSTTDYDIGTLQDSIHNSTNFAQEVTYTFTAFIEGATNLGDCENGLDTTIRIWVEPTPLVTATADESTICNLDTAKITFISPTTPTREVKIRWQAWSEYADSVTGVPSGWQYGGGLNVDSIIAVQLVNNTNANQRAFFEIEAITLDADSIMNCTNGKPDTVIVIVQPGLLVELVPQGDTICDASAVSIDVTSISNPSGTFLFSYKVRPENPSSVSVTYTNAPDTLGVPKGHTITDNLDNSSDTAQLVRFIVTPFVSGGGGCPGTPDTSYIWVEPTPEVLLAPQGDTICDGESANFTITSPTGATVPVLFSFVRDYNTDSLSVIAGADTDLVKNAVVNEQITNLTRSVQAIKYIVTPYTLDGNNNPRCINGDKDTIYILVNPTPDISVVASLDSILCDSATVSFSIESLSNGLIGDWVYDVDTVPSNYGLIKGYSGGNNLTADFADQLINLSKSVQWVDYIFHPQILHTSTGVPYCGNNAVNDTTIRIYVNPTPELEITILDTLVCNDEVFDISIDSSVASLGKVRYHLVVDYAGGAVTGRHSNTDYDIGTLQDSIHNSTNFAQEVTYTFTAFIEGATNLGDCENGLDTTIHIWVEPTPLVTATANEATICNLDTAKITFISPTIPTREVKFRWRAWSEFPASVSGFPADSANWQYGGGLNVDSIIAVQLVNNTNANQRAFFEIEGITLDADSIMRCSNGISDTVIVIVQPGLLVELVPQGDTICDASAVSINITSISNPSGTFLFSYQVRPEKPSSVSVSYTNAPDTLGVTKGHTITDNLDNLSDTAQLVRFIVTPFVSGGGGCPGTPDTSYIWVEPSITISALSDTICTEDFTSIGISSKQKPIRGIRYTWTVTDLSGGAITGYSNSTGNGYPITRDIEQQLINTSSDSASILYTITPYTIWGDSSFHCSGSAIDLRIWVNPVPDILVVASPDTILCDSGTVSFVIDSLSANGFAGDWVYDVNAVPSNVGLISGYTTDTDLSFGFVDQLINTSDTVQWVDYTFHPQLLNSSDGTPYCGNSSVNDTTIRILVNPTPRLKVTVNPAQDTLLCDSAYVSFDIDSLIKGTTGQWVYDVSSVVSDGLFVLGNRNTVDSVKSFSEQLINTSDTVQWVDYTFHARINNPRTGLSDCDNGSAWDTIIRIWIEPYPVVSLTPMNDSLCSGDTTSIAIGSITSPFYPVQFEYFAVPENPTEVVITPIGSNTGLPNGFIIRNEIINTSDTAQAVNYKVVPYTVDGNGDKHCEGDTVVSEIIVEPALLAILTPMFDTICNEEHVSIHLTSDSKTSQTLKFYYEIEVAHPGSVLIGYDTAWGTGALDKGRFIVDTLTNITDTAQLVRFYVTPYVEGAPGDGCPGVTTIAEVWVEPSITISALSDTICTEDFTSIGISSNQKPIRGIRYTWTVTDLSGGAITGYSNSTGNGYPITRDIAQQLINTSSDSASILYTITPYTIWGDSSFHCSGPPIDLRIWVNPVPDIKVVFSPDSILCDSGTVSFVIDSLSANGFAGNWVYDVNAVPSNVGLISGYTTDTDLSFGFVDQLINTSDTVQWVDYSFHPQLLNSSGGTPYCGNSSVNDTTIRILVNPTPRLKVTVNPAQDTLLCDSAYVSFDIDSLIKGTTGQWVYDVSSVVSDGLFVLGNRNTVDSVKSFSEQLINTSDTVQWVDYTFHARINNPRTGLSECDNGSAWDTTIRIWIEPYPVVSLTPMNDSLCSGDITSITIGSITSPFYPVQFEYFAVPENPTEVSITPIGPDKDLPNGYIIRNEIINLSDTAQVINYQVVPYTIDGLGFKHCEGDTVVSIILVEPTPKVSVSPKYDTICNDTRVSIDISSVTRSSRPVRFRYFVNAPVEVDVIPGTGSDLTTADFIIDSLHNTSNDFQEVQFIITPYTLMPSGVAERCSGINDTAYIILEPSAKVYFDHNLDTICNGMDYNSVTLNSVTNPINDIRFNYKIVPKNPSEVNFTYNGSNFNLAKTNTISDNLVNKSDTIQEVYVIVTPFLLDGIGIQKCPGISDTIIVQLTPTLVMVDSVRQYPRYNIRCFGNNDGAIWMYPKGGGIAFGPSVFNHSNLEYKLNGLYPWPNDLLTTSYYMVDSIGVGTYTLAASDRYGCTTAPKSETLTQAAEAFTVEIRESVPIKCSNTADGVVYAAKNGGAYYIQGLDTVGYTTTRWIKYGLSGLPIEVADTMYNVFPGDFKIYVTDTNQCSAEDSVTILGASTASKQVFETVKYDGFDITCTGMADGILRTQYVTLGDVTLYQLFNTDSDTTFIDSVRTASEIVIPWDSLGAGKYSLKVTSSLGCSKFDDITLIEPSLPLKITDYSLSSYHSNTWNVICSDSANGSIDINTVAGGRGVTRYQYNWSTDDIAFSTIKNVEGLSQGDYKIVVSDGYCADSAIITLTAPDSIYVSNRIVDRNLCFGDNTGRIELIIAGGEGPQPYNYSWVHDIGNNNSVAENLFADTYFVSVQDSIGCIMRDTIEVTEPNKLQITNNVTDYHGYAVSCKNGNDGEISIFTTGGTGIKNFAWNYAGQPFPISDSVISDLEAGAYSLNLQDENGCTVLFDTILESPTELVINSFTTENKICSTPGIGNVTASGGLKTGSGDYDYLWSDGATGSSTNQLDAGSQWLTITDWNGCEVDTVFDILLVSNIDISIDTVKAISCFGDSDGILGILSSGVTLPYKSTIWNGVDDGIKTTLSNANAGSYVLSIIDSKDCMATDTFELEDPLPVEARFTPFGPSCNNFADGYILLDATGGNGDYRYTIGNTPLASDIAENLTAGEYKIRIQDKKNCQGEDTLTVTQPDELVIEEILAERIPPGCPDAPDGTMMVTATGGTEPYTFRWFDNDFTSNMLTGAKEDWYGVNVTDVNNCFASDTLHLVSPLQACLEIPTAITPNDDGFNDYWDITNPMDEDIDLTTIYPQMIIIIYNRWGQVIWESDRGYPESKAWRGTDKSGRALPVDSYHYIIHLNNDSGRTLTGIVTIVK